MKKEVNEEMFSDIECDTHCNEKKKREKSKNMITSLVLKIKKKKTYAFLLKNVHRLFDIR